MLFFLISAASRPALGLTQAPIQWVPGALTLGIKRPGRVAEQSPPSSAEVKNEWSYTSTLPVRLNGVVLNQARDTFSWCGAQLSTRTTLLFCVPLQGARIAQWYSAGIRAR
jgi:hypothetical protein